MKITEEIKVAFKERWKLYALGYLIGYGGYVSQSSTLNFSTLFPIKLTAIFAALIIGTAFHYGNKKKKAYVIFSKLFKSMGICVLVGLIAISLQQILLLVGIDISPLLGIPT